MSTWVLMGAGEFEPWHEPIDRRLLDGRAGRVVIAPTAAAHEGATTWERWASKGVAHYEGLGVEAEVLPLRTRDDAGRAEVVDALDEADVLFFSGGNPWRLAEVLRDTPLWTRIRERVDDGMAFVGCSAGVAFLTERTYDSDAEGFDEMFRPGIGHFRRLLFGPHWDVVDDWVPGAKRFIAGTVGPGEVLIGIDEDTAMVGDGASWDVVGRGGVHLLRDGAWTVHGGGTTFEQAFRVD